MSAAAAPIRYTAGQGASQHLDFLSRFATKEKERQAPKPAPLSAAEHAANRRQLSTVRFVKPNYSDATQINITGILRKWIR